MKKEEIAPVRSRKARVCRSTRGRSARTKASCAGTATTATSSSVGVSIAIIATRPIRASVPVVVASRVSIRKRCTSARSPSTRVIRSPSGRAAKKRGGSRCRCASSVSRRANSVRADTVT